MPSARSSKILAALLAASSACHGGAFTLVRKDALNVSSFNAGTNWNVIAAPAANNTYSTNGYSLRTPENNAALTFAGDSLTVPPATDGDSGIIFKGTAGTLITIPNLILSGGRGLGNGNSPVTQTLDGNVTVTADTTIDCGSNATFHLSTDFISGTGSLGMVNVGTATTSPPSAFPAPTPAGPANSPPLSPIPPNASSSKPPANPTSAEIPRFSPPTNSPSAAPHSGHSRPSPSTIPTAASAWIRMAAPLKPPPPSS